MPTAHDDNATTGWRDLADQLNPSAELLTFGQAAARMGVDVTQIRRWVRSEQCPRIRDGRRVRIPAAWVDDPAGWLR